MSGQQQVTDDVRLGHGYRGTVDLTIRNHVAVLTLNADQNRFNTTTIRRINAALDQVESNPNVHALLTVGANRFYSAGLDLPWMKHLSETMGSKAVGSFLLGFTNLVARILTFPMPTIAVLNGHAAAGGAILALAHDLRLMRRDRGFFYLSEVHLGLNFRYLAKELITRKIPQGEAITRAVIMGQRLPGKEACRLGIVSAIYEEHELLNQGLKMAQELLVHGPYERRSMRNVKESIYDKILAAKVTTAEPEHAFDLKTAASKAKM